MKYITNEIHLRFKSSTLFARYLRSDKINSHCVLTYLFT